MVITLASPIDRRKKLTFCDTHMGENITFEVKEDDRKFSFDEFEFTDAKLANADDEETYPIIKATKTEIIQWFKPWQKALILNL